MIGGDIGQTGSGHTQAVEDVRLRVEDFRSGGIPDDGDDGLAAHDPPEVSGAGHASDDPGAAVAPTSIRDYLAQTHGYQFAGDVADDQAALIHLVQRAQQAEQLKAQLRQADVYRQLGQQLAPKAEQLQRFLGQEQQPATPARKPWEPPPFDPRWAGLVEPVGDGLYAGKPGVNPSIVKAVNEYAEWSHNYHSNPGAVLQPWMEEVRSHVVEEMRGELRQLRQQQAVQSHIQQIATANSAWAYARDAGGQLVPDPINGGAALSLLGQQYVGLDRTLADRGVRDPIHRDEIARMMLAPQLSALTGRSTSTTRSPSTSGRRSGADRVQQGLRAVNAVADSTQERHSSRAGSLGDRIRRAFDESGVNDRTFRRMGPDGKYPGDN